MKTSEIWQLPVEQRMAAFIERWKDLNEYTGCRTLRECDEMATIADAIMQRLIRDHEQVEHLKEKLRNARLAAHWWKKLAKLLWAPAPDWEKRALAAEAKLRRAEGRDA